jgi:putative sigma-54 modulation protein
MIGDPSAVGSIAKFLGHADSTLSYAAIDALADKLDRQLIKHKEKSRGR